MRFKGRGVFDARARLPPPLGCGEASLSTICTLTPSSADREEVECARDGGAC